MQQEILTQADKARLMLNLPTLANRWVKFGGHEFPVLHLGLGDLEQFRAACAPIEALYLKFAKSELPLVAFLRIYTEEVVRVLVKDVPRAASIVLGLPEGAVIAFCCPLEGFSAVLAQWLHNQEIGALQGFYPPPPDDDEERELPDDPSANNPMGIVQKLASAYHWEFDKILKTTVPQVYLMGNDAAWSYAKIRSSSKEERTKRAPIIVDGKKRTSFEGMKKDEYQNYLNNVFNMTVPNVDGIQNPAGGL